MLDFGQVKKFNLGWENSDVIRAKINGVTVWEKPADYSEPFYIEDVSGETNTLSIVKNQGSSPTLTIEYSTDKINWSILGTTDTAAITYIIPANGKVYLRCSANQWCDGSRYNKIFASGNHNVGGNIMSLLYGSNFTGNETIFPSGSIRNFYQLFDSNSKLINASSLLMPATTLTDYCYYKMFRGTLLTTAPKLPATTLAADCYDSMFGFCSLLTTAPELPATTLANSCYNGMFKSCTSLTTAPTLPATTLASKCYYNMFYNCFHLNYIKCLATDISASNCIYNWVSGVAASGTFVKAANMTSWPSGTSGIPSGWTVQDA